MDVDLDAFERSGDRDGVVAAAIINEDDRVHKLLVADFLIGLAESLGRVIGRHDHRDFLVSIHSSYRN